MFRLRHRQHALEPSLRGPDVHVKRRADRGRYDRASVFAIVDEALICHVACSAAGRSFSLPTAHVRVDEHLYLHGARSNAALHGLCESGTASVTFTLIDGLVLARTAFHHSMNYRCAVIYGVCERVADEDKAAALDAFMESIAPGRSREVRPGNAKELAATTVLRLPLDEFACKIREGGPKDDEADLDLPVWACVLPLTLAPRAVIPEDASARVPDYVAEWG